MVFESSQLVHILFVKGGEGGHENNAQRKKIEQLFFSVNGNKIIEPQSILFRSCYNIRLCVAFPTTIQHIFSGFVFRTTQSISIMSLWFPYVVVEALYLT